MQRRQFLAASLATSAAALAPSALAQDNAQPQTSRNREYYLIRRYHINSGPQSGMAEKYFADALIPALGRMSLGPVAAMRLEYGPETPQFYLVIPGTSAEALAQLDLRLAQDAEFMKAAAPFWDAPISAPAFDRIETSLQIAMEGWPRLTPPEKSLGKRIFQLRTYESASHKDHVHKVEMFNSGEFDIFVKAGCRPVFFSDTLISTRMPSLTYMLCFADLNELTEKWKAFSSDPNWKKLQADPRFSYEQIVSNISNQVLQPLSCSQI